MSIASEIQRIMTAKSSIKSILESKSLTFQPADKLFDFSLKSAELPNILIPEHFDFDRGYITSSGWVWEVKNPPECFLDIYQVLANHTYFIILGDDVGTRYRACTVTEDITLRTSGTAKSSVNIQQTNDPGIYDTIMKSGKPVFTATADGWLVIQKDNKSKTGIRTFVFDITTPTEVSGLVTTPSSDNIERIEESKGNLKTVMEDRGIEVDSSLKIDQYPSLVSNLYNIMVPYASDLNTGYVNGSTWTYDTAGNNRNDVYKVTGNHVYALFLGATVGNRFRTLFLQSDPVGSEVDIPGTVIYSKESYPATWDRLVTAETPTHIWTAPDDGFVAVQKDNVSTDGLRTYMLDLTYLVNSPAPEPYED